MFETDRLSQTRLRVYHFLSIIVYAVCVFVFPFCFTLSKAVITERNIDIAFTFSSNKYPIILYLVCMIIMLFGLKWINTYIQKLNIYKLDGSISSGVYIVKILFNILTKVLVPIGLIAVAIYFNRWVAGFCDNAYTVIESNTENILECLKRCFESLKATVSAYSSIIIIDAFTIAIGFIIDCTFVDVFENELDIREKVSQENAVKRRIESLTNK